MNELTLIQAERACERLIHRSVRLIDAYDYEGFLRLWAADGEMSALGKDHVGHAGLRAWLSGREKDLICRHFVSNTIIDVIDENHATGHSYATAYRIRGWRGREPGPMNLPSYVLEYADSFRRDPDLGWLIARRNVTVVIAGVEQRQALLAR
jgi:hypothetical protein